MGSIRRLRRNAPLQPDPDRDFFWTPDALADTLVQAANVQPGQLVLEPSAGVGHIARAIMRAGAEVVCVEAHAPSAASMLDEGLNAVCDDFLSWKFPMEFDACCMNPPFKWAIEHFRYAWNMVKEGGVIAAILPMSFKNATNPWKGFRNDVEMLDPGHIWFPIMEDAFKEVGTSVQCGMLVMTVRKERNVKFT